MSIIALNAIAWLLLYAAFAGKHGFAGFTDEQREEVARILEIVGEDGLPEPRDLDVALDAIEAALKV